MRFVFSRCAMAGLAVAVALSFISAVFAQPGMPARQLATVDEVLAVADFVSLHCPGGGENTRLIDERRLASMKTSAFLINTARGDVVDEDALVQGHTREHRQQRGDRGPLGADVHDLQQHPGPGQRLLGLEVVAVLQVLERAFHSTQSQRAESIDEGCKGPIQLALGEERADTVM